MYLLVELYLAVRNEMDKDIGIIWIKLRMNEISKTGVSRMSSL